MVGPVQQHPATPSTPTPPPLPREADPVPGAVDRIRESLDEGFLDWDVSHSDLTDARDTLAGLTPEQQSEVISQLDDATLDKWMAEVNGLSGGFSADEKRDFLDGLAANLNGEQLARVASNMRYVGDAEALGAAVGRQGGQTAVDFVDHMGEKLNGETTLGNFTTAEDVVARTIGNMWNTADIDSALGALTPEQRQSLGTNTYRSGGESSEAYSQLYSAVARSGNLETRTEFFRYAAQSSQELRDGVDMPFSSQDFPAIDPFYKGMNDLFRTDPRGMTDLMASQEMGMKDLTNYLEVAVIKGDEQMIGQLGAQIRSGSTIPGADQSDFARFNHDFDANPNNEHFRNAELSGYFTGAAMAATANVTSDAEKQQALAVSILTGGAATVASAIPVGGQIAVGAGSVVTGVVANQISENAGDSREAFFNAMQEAGVPRDGNGHLPRGEARTQFNAAVSEVLSAHGMSN